MRTDRPLEELIGYVATPEIMATLPERERLAIELRFGMLDGRPRKLKEVGLALDVGTERASQIVRAGVRKLRHPSRKRLYPG